MPIRVLCPSCSAALTAPDTAAGKTVKCPKCQMPMILPAAEPVVAVTSTPTPPRTVTDDRTRKTSSQNDDEDYDDDRPRQKSKKGKKKTKKSGPPIALIGGSMAALILLMGLAVFVLKGSSNEKMNTAGAAGSGATSSGGGTAATKGIEWTKIDAPDGTFSAYIPGEGGEAVKFEQNQDNTVAGTWKSLNWSRKYNGRFYSVDLRSYPPSAVEFFTPEKIATPKKEPGVREEVVTIGRHKGLRSLSTDNDGSFANLKFGLGGGRILDLMVFTEKKGGKLNWDDPIIQEFFTKIEFKP